VDLISSEAGVVIIDRGDDRGIWPNNRGKERPCGCDGKHSTDVTQHYTISESENSTYAT
jgi:hypothetical protein